MSACGADKISAVDVATVGKALDQVETAFCVKEVSGRITYANMAMARLYNARMSDTVVGLPDARFLAASSAHRLRTIEQRVIRTLHPCLNDLILCKRLRGPPVWLLTSFWPLSEEGRRTGVATVARSLSREPRRAEIYERLVWAIDKFKSELPHAMSVGELADDSGVSDCKFKRDFRLVFNETPRSYFTRLRFEVALDALANDAPVTEASMACGYSDLSAFTRRFHACFGFTPSAFRSGVRGLGKDRFALPLMRVNA